MGNHDKPWKHGFHLVFVTHIFLHLKHMPCLWHAFSFIQNIMFAPSIPFHLKAWYVHDSHFFFHLKWLYCSQHTISFIQNVHNVCNTHSYYTALCTSQRLTYFSYTYSKVLLCISKINAKKIEIYLILVITEKLRRNAKCHYVMKKNLFIIKSIIVWKRNHLFTK